MFNLSCDCVQENKGTFCALSTREMSGGEFFKESSRCLFSNPSTANCLSDSEDNVSLHIVILPNNCRGGRPVRATITLYPIGRPVRATITLYPIGRPVRATITLYPIGRPVRATITLYPIGRPDRATITLYPIGRPVRATITLYLWTTTRSNTP